MDATGKNVPEQLEDTVDFVQPVHGGIYLACIRSLEPRFEKILSQLPASRQDKIMRYRIRDDQLRCMAAWLLIREFLRIEDEAQLCTNEWGKPYLPEGPHFNLSHSGDYAAIAVTKTPVGIDIEQCGARRWNETLAKRVLTANERAWLESYAHDAGATLYEQRRDEGFLVLWTRKESVLKALGTGLATPPASIESLPLNELPHWYGATVLRMGTWLYRGHVLSCSFAFEE